MTFFQNKTLFTVNAYDDGYFENGEPSRPLEKICFNSQKKHFGNTEVINFNNPIVLEMKEKFPKIYASNKEVFSDIIRLKYMSIKPDLVYMDCDVYFNQIRYFPCGFSLADGKSFFCISNGNDIETPARLLSCYDDNEILTDKEITAKAGLKTGKIPCNLIHFAGVGGWNRIPVTYAYSDNKEKVIEMYDRLKLKRLNLLSNTLLNKVFSGSGRLIYVKKMQTMQSRRDANNIYDIISSHKCFAGRW